MNALVSLQTEAMPVSCVSRAAIAQRIVGAFEAASAGLFTTHDKPSRESRADCRRALPWVIRRGGPLPIIVGRYETQEEADCACLARTMRKSSLEVADRGRREGGFRAASLR
jgi:hypothetical protein